MAEVILARGREQRLLTGHPWVFRTEIEEIRGEYNPGDIVEVRDSRGRFSGRGFLNPHSMIAVRILTRTDEPIDRGFFHRRFVESWERRRFLGDTEACRVVFAEADGLPGLIVDKFGEYLVMQFLALGVAVRQEMLVGIARAVMAPRGIYLRNDAPVRELEGLPLEKRPSGEAFDPVVTFHENGLTFTVDVAEGQKTGYFLDQRYNRAAIAPFVAGAEVLDAFCYVGSFAVHAAKYGARSVTGVDVSEWAIAMARKHAAMNGVADRTEFVVANAFDYLRREEQAGRRYDVVILDPPAFARNRAALPGAIRGYKEINLRGMRLCQPGGRLVTASCSQHVDHDTFVRILQDAAADARRTVRILLDQGQPPDHPVLLASPQTRYLKFLVLEVM